MNLPRRRTSFAASLNSSAPAATRAVYSPRLWPARHEGTKPVFSFNALKAALAPSDESYMLFAMPTDCEPWPGSTKAVLAIKRLSPCPLLCHSERSEESLGVRYAEILRRLRLLRMTTSCNNPKLFPSPFSKGGLRGIILVRGAAPYDYRRHCEERFATKQSHGVVHQTKNEIAALRSL